MDRLFCCLVKLLKHDNWVGAHGARDSFTIPLIDGVVQDGKKEICVSRTSDNNCTGSVCMVPVETAWDLNPVKECARE